MKAQVFITLTTLALAGHKASGYTAGRLDTTESPLYTNGHNYQQQQQQYQSQQLPLDQYMRGQQYQPATTESPQFTDHNYQQQQYHSGQQPLQEYINDQQYQQGQHNHDHEQFPIQNQQPVDPWQQQQQQQQQQQSSLPVATSTIPPRSVVSSLPYDVDSPSPSSSPSSPFSSPSPSQQLQDRHQYASSLLDSLTGYRPSNTFNEPAPVETSPSPSQTQAPPTNTNPTPTYIFPADVNPAFISTETPVAEPNPTPSYTQAPLADNNQTFVSTQDPIAEPNPTPSYTQAPIVNPLPASTYTQTPRPLSETFRPIFATTDAISANNDDDVYGHVQDKVEQAVEKAGEVYETILDKAQDAAEQAGEIFGQVGENAQEVVEQAVEKVQDAYDHVSDQAQNGAEQMVDHVQDAAEQAVDKVQDAYDHVSDKTQNAAEQVADHVGDAYEQVVDKAEDVVENVRDAAEQTIEWIRGVFDGSDAGGKVDQAAEVVNEVLDQAAEKIDQAAEVVEEAVDQAAEKIEQNVDQQQQQQDAFDAEAAWRTLVDAIGNGSYKTGNDDDDNSTTTTSPTSDEDDDVTTTTPTIITTITTIADDASDEITNDYFPTSTSTSTLAPSTTAGDDSSEVDTTTTTSAPVTTGADDNYNVTDDIEYNNDDFSTAAAVAYTTTTPTTITRAVPSLCDGCKMRHGVGYARHPSDCTLFVTCRTSSTGAPEVAAVRPCPHGLYWSQDKLTCDFKRNVKCNDDICLGRKKTKRAGGSCRGFWDCTSGSAEAKCCARSFAFNPVTSGCERAPGCQDACLGTEVKPAHLTTPRSYECGSGMRSVPGDVTVYEVRTGTTWTRMRCPATLAFSLNPCGCTVARPKQQPKLPVCKPELDLQFDADHTDQSPQRVHVANQGVKVSGGHAFFDGKSQLTVPRFAHAWWGETVFVHVRFQSAFADPALFPAPAHVGQREALVSNGGCCGDPTLSVTVEPQGVQFFAKTQGSAQPANFTVPYGQVQGEGWQDVLFKVAAGRASGYTDGGYGGGDVMGPVMTSRGALVIGGGAGCSNFRGVIDTLQLYRCRPQF